MTPSPSFEAEGQFGTAPQTLRVGLFGVLTARLRYGASLSPLPADALTALIEPDIRVARAWAKQRGATPTFLPSWGDFLSAEIPLSAMILPIPLRLRHDTIRACLERRIAVLCELPFAYSLKEQVALIQLAQEQNTLLMPVLPRAFDPAFREVGKIVQEGTLGELRQVRVEWSLPMAESAVLENGVDDVEEDLLLQNLLCQSVFTCQEWFGDPLTVSADVTAFRKENLRIRPKKLEENTLATLIIAHERAQVTQTVSRTRSSYPGERYLLTGTQGQLEFVARSGTHHSTAATPTITLHKGGHKEVLEEYGEYTQAMRIEEALAYFLDSLRSETPDLTLTKSMHLALNAVHGAYLSTVGSNKVSLPLHRAPSFESFFRRFETTKHLS